ncbi:MAG: TonB-dependent receptor [Proteobacteria bacterium]|nr:TonB-dependent receptor [Pseudomonadota bacterium]
MNINHQFLGLCHVRAGGLIGFAPALIVGLFAGGNVAAQDVIEEIIVTAQKRQQTLQEVPVAVTVVTANDMRQAQMLDIKDLQSIVPSLRITQLQTTANTNFIIRGFGNGANNAGIEPSVAVFVDGVYRSRTASSLADFPNLERIEVLRGPQSTLFGKNASAGVISVITAKPDMQKTSGSASITLGEYSQVIVKGNVTGPLSDTVAFSLSGSVNNRDGYYTNLVDGEEYGERDRWGVRGQLLFQPSDKLEFRLIADYEEIDEVCCGVANLVDGPTGVAIRLIGGDLVSNQPFAYANFYDFNPVNEIENNGVSLQIDYDFDAVTLTSITSFRNQSRFENSDVDFTSARLINPNSSDTELDTFTQELRLASSGDGPLDWMIGVFYFDEEVEISNVLNYGVDFRAYTDVLTGGGVTLLETTLGLPAGTFFAAGQGNFETAGQDNQATSIFGQVDWHMTDRVTLTLGANYTEDEKDAFVGMLNTDVFSSLDFVLIGFAGAFQALTGGAAPTPANFALFPVEFATAQAISVEPCPPATALPCNSLLALQPLQFLPPFLDFPNAVESGSSSDDDVTWTVRLAFDATDNVNLYVGASTGFKATSWNLSRDSLPFASDFSAILAAGLGLPNLATGFRFAGPEDATVYEIGLKARFERGALNIAIFDQEIEGFQSNIFNGTGFNLQNAGKQSTTGVELETTWLPTDAWKLSFAATWLDPKYDVFPNFVFPDGLVQDLSGTQVPGVHEFSMNTSAVYNFDIGASASGFIRAEYIYEDEIQIIENVSAIIASREVSTFNASIGLQWDNGFEAILWGRNLNNDDYLLSAFPAVAQAGSFSGYPNEPRTYGLTLRKSF